MNLQTPSRSFEVGEVHYDTGNKLFEQMLGKSMVYTCAYWKNASNLDEAQEAKLDLVCKKIGLKPGQKILDIGCGWGSFAKYAAEKYGATVVGVTVSKEQAEYARELCKGLPVEIRFQDYRSVDEKFDHIVSIGMVEQVGYKNHRSFMEFVHRCLKDDGLFLLHVIGQNESKIVNDPWLNKYIFPNAMAPSPKQLTTAFEGLFILEDWHCFGNDYYRTLKAWHENFVKNWSTIEKIDKSYDQRFYRMWTYGLLVGAGAHLSGTKVSLWQIVLSKSGIPEGYVSVR
jgi:cyclopropane-fatty-acyl-phospholipid synthase